MGNKGINRNFSRLQNLQSSVDNLQKEAENRPDPDAKTSNAEVEKLKEQLAEQLKAAAEKEAKRVEAVRQKEKEDLKEQLEAAQKAATEHKKLAEEHAAEVERVK